MLELPAVAIFRILYWKINWMLRLYSNTLQEALGPINKQSVDGLFQGTTRIQWYCTTPLSRVLRASHRGPEGPGLSRRYIEPNNLLAAGVLSWFLLTSPRDATSPKLRTTSRTFSDRRNRARLATERRLNAHQTDFNSALEPGIIVAKHA
jgi:hypothetical protein